MTTKPKPRNRRGPQARGLARRQQLEDAAETLLETREIETVSLADIAEAADIPVASAYSFYSNASDLFAHLLIKQTKLMFDSVERSIDPRQAESWQEIVAQLIDGVARYLRNSRPLQQLRLSGKALPEVRYADDRPTGVDFAARLRRLIESEFVLPQMVGGDRPFIVMLDIAEAVVVSEYIRSRGMPKGIAQEAKRAALAYLRLYIPEYIPRLETDGDGSKTGGSHGQAK